MNNAIKLILAVLLFICLIDMPYGYYQLVRISGLIGFSFLAYKASEKQNNTEMIIFIGLALLFQPFIKVTLGRQIWNVVDVIIGIGLVMTVLKKNE